MSKKAWREDANRILDRVYQYLQENDETLWIGQEPYKNDFFQIFETAFLSRFCVPSDRVDHTLKRRVQCKSQRPLISGDSIWEHARKQGWVTAEMDCSEDRYKNIRQVMAWWDEWTYAWRKNPPKRKFRKRHVVPG